VILSDFGIDFKPASRRMPPPQQQSCGNKPLENIMKSISVIRTFAAVGLATAAIASTAASADDFDCFPLCETAKAASCVAAPNTPSVANVTIEKIENVNNKLKPIKEIAGYIESPQSLAVKLINDHVVKIPAWVGYAIDPVGAIKNKAMSEVRDRAKTALKAEFAKSAGVDCVAPVEAQNKLIAPSVEIKETDV
jgi:hypothetical protein